MSGEQPAMSVVVTGASSGIGRACALRLDERGVRVLAGVRRQADGDSLRQDASGQLTPVLMDVTVPDSIASASQLIADIVGESGLSGLVNSAGVYFGGPLEFCDLTEVRRAFDVNVFGIIGVTQTLLPLLRAGRGRIVNISSVSGLIALPFAGPYAASKYALEALSDSWRVELRPWGIHIALVEPGVVETPILGKIVATLKEVREGYPLRAHELYGPVFGLTERHHQRGIPVGRVAKVVEHALLAHRPRRRYLVGPDARIAAIFRKLPAWLRDGIIARCLPKYGE